MQNTRIQSAQEFASALAPAQSRLMAIAYGIIGNRQDAEDVVQQGISIAIEKNQNFETEYQFIGWLSGIVRNCALNHRRKNWRRKTRPTDPEELVSVVGSVAGESPIDERGKIDPMQQSFDDRVQTALQQLAPKARACLLLRTVEELSYREISKLMDIPEGTAMNMVHRSKKQLRSVLASNEGGTE